MEKLKKPDFLREKYTGLNKSPEVDSAARRTKVRTGQELPMMASDDRIQNYLDRLKEIFENPDKDKRERGIEFLKYKLHEQFVIKPEEIPESYFESIKRKHREAGHGDIEIPEDYRNELSETIVADQTRSLDTWIDYLSSEDAKYPDWLKYFAVRSMLRMGRYDKKKKSFTERTGSTIAPFPDLNREALAIVLESFERQTKGEQPKFGYDIQEDTKRQFIEFLGRKNFAKLYALAVEEFKPIAEELLQITDGEWRTYPRSSDPKPLVDSIAPYGTGWCLRGKSMAERYLVRDKNELQVFYSLDKEGEPTVPRVVTVVNADNQLTEVRGVAQEENLDPYIGFVVDAKLKEFPDGENYKKKSADMKMLTEIEQKVKQKQELTKDDITFLYETNAPIEGFGDSPYGKCSDPRVKELREGRNVKDDLSFVLGIPKEQISIAQDEALSANTLFHYGDIDLGSHMDAKGLTLPKSISGNLNLSYLTDAKGLTLPQSIGGNLDLHKLTDAKGLMLPQSIGGNLDLHKLTDAKGLTLPQSVGGSLYLGNLTYAEGLTLPQSVGGSLSLGLTDANGLTLPQSIGGNLNLSYLIDAEGLTLPQSIGGNLDLHKLTDAKKQELRVRFPHLAEKII